MAVFEELFPEQESMAREYGAVWGRRLDNGDVALVIPLLLHVALYLNPDGTGGCASRYCIASEELAIKAAREYEQTGRVRYWQKHHTTGITVEGRYAYPEGVLNTPENALYEVDWDADELREQYPYYGSVHRLFGVTA